MVKARYKGESHARIRYAKALRAGLIREKGESGGWEERTRRMLTFKLLDVNGCLQVRYSNGVPFWEWGDRVTKKEKADRVEAE